MKNNSNGLKKAMALDRLGDAYMYLRETYATTPWNTAEGNGLLDAAQILRNAFAEVKADFSLIDFTEQSEAI